MLLSESQQEHYVLRILSCQRTDDDEERSELNTVARYLYKPGGTEITYTEVDENGLPEGETCMTVLGPELITIQKSGFTEATMVLEKGKTHYCSYRTIVGAMDMQLNATEVYSSLHPDGGVIRMTYILEIGDGFSAVNSIEIQISPAVKG